MKTNSTSGNNSQPAVTNRKRPENKDNLDSREGEEQLSKGGDVTHNKKQTRNSTKRVKNNG